MHGQSAGSSRMTAPCRGVWQTEKERKNENNGAYPSD